MGREMSGKIDFVITWVDGSDPAWQKSRSSYLAACEEDHSFYYRDWDNLQYWFRGIEKYTPWVNKVHFVTCGHLPPWLNTRHPQLNIVKHEDFMPEKYLPTFNSHSIEINLHRIKGLEEQFVYFNDDTFIIDHMQPQDFFKQGLPCASLILTVLAPRVPGDPFFHYYINDLAVINHHFSKKQLRKKWFSLKYGKLLLRNLYLAPVYCFYGFFGFLNFHMPNSYLISTFKEVWEKEYHTLDAAAAHKFRTISDVNQYVFSYWQFAAGNFHPRKTDCGRFFIAGENDQELLASMSAPKCQMICINDSIAEIDFEAEKDMIKQQFNKLLPDQSAFEL